MKDKIIGSLLLLVLTGAVLYSQKTESGISEFEAWKIQHKPVWSPAEQAYREFIFMKNLAILSVHNADPTQTYKMGINQFSVLTDEEFALTYLKPKHMHSNLESTFEDLDLQGRSLKINIDWVVKGMVSPVKNQGNCGSCWAFSAVGTLESQALINGKSGVSLSEQQLVDCSRKYGNEGCNGGFNYAGLAFVKDNGIASTSEYPYVARNQACKVNSGSYKIRQVGAAKGCTGVLNALASRPIGVSVDANNWSRYASGIFNNCKTSLDHDVLLVGATDTYYKIKNSWGSGWGENGFIRLAPGNTCGVCQDKSPWPV